MKQTPIGTYEQLNFIRHKKTSSEIRMEKLKTKIISEGKAKLFVPAESFKDPFHLPVFYNPKMKFSRSVSSVAFGSAVELLKKGKSEAEQKAVKKGMGNAVSVVDGLCSQGARGIRYAKENENVGKVFFVDANKDAIKLLRKNVKLNKLGKKAEIHYSDLNRFFSDSEEAFDFIEIDPFGSPVFFLESAIRKLQRKAVLSITATDLANLCGAKTAPCIRHYDAKPLNNEFAHETAIRILVGRIARSAAVYDFSIKPLLSFYRMHYVKTFLLMERGAEKADKCISENLGFVSYCPKCLSREMEKRNGEKCGNCGSKNEYAGKLWISDLCDNEFLKRMEVMNRKGKVKTEKKGKDATEEENNKIETVNCSETANDGKEIEKLLKILEIENRINNPFYDLHKVAKTYKIPHRKTEEIMERLGKKGFKASRTHFCPTGIKSNAGISEVLEALR